MDHIMIAEEAAFQPEAVFLLHTDNGTRVFHFSPDGGGGKPGKTSLRDDGCQWILKHAETQK